MTDYVAYVRVSTARQGKSGLGLQAQQAAVDRFLQERGGTLLAPPHVEVESGKRNSRPELDKALNRCKLTGATLLVAKLDRLSRNAAFLLTLKESGVEFVAADMPDANNFTVGVMALVAQQEREAISKRTKEALAAAKAAGKQLGGWREYGEDHPLRGERRKPVDPAMGTAARRERARAFAGRVAQALEDIQGEGVTSLAAIARRLNELGIRTRRGGKWQATQVARVMDKVISGGR